MKPITIKTDSVKKNKIEKITHYAVLVVIVGMLGNIIFSLFTTDKNILNTLDDFKPHVFFCALFLAFVPWITNTLRLLIWTRFLGKRYLFHELFKITISADVGSAVSPTAIGGGYVKVGMLIKRGLKPGAATSLMTLGSVEDGLFFLFAIPVSMFLTSGWKIPVLHQLIGKLNFKSHFIWIVLILGCIAALVYYIVNHSTIIKPNGFVYRIRQKLKQAWKDFLSVYLLIGKTGKSRFLLTFTLTAIQWLSRYSVVTMLLASLNLKVDPVLFFLFQWITFTIMTMIPTPGAAAGAEASFYFIYSSLIPRELLGIMTTGWRFLTFYLQVGLGIFILLAMTAGRNLTPVTFQEK